MTLLCVPIFVESPEQVKRDAALAAEAGADIVELRLDTLSEPIVLPNLSIPYIVTCRPTWEGGESDLSDGQRLDLLGAMSESAAYIDVELETYSRRPNVADLVHHPNRLIVSAHDFRGRPRLDTIIVSMAERLANVHKVAWMARSIRDNVEALEIIEQRMRPTIALCMGEAGLISRVLAKKFGAFLTFASLRDESATAPGQVTIHDMKRLYRWDALNAKTKVYGVVGSPIMHSMSPAIHNAAFETAGHDGVYLPLLVNPGYESFKAFMESFLAFVPLDLSGLSITIPHKENALRYLKEKSAEVEPLAEQIGAVNTIVIDRTDGRLRLRGLNTDYAAILDMITSTLKIQRTDLADKRVAVIGAGGTGRTAVAALAAHGVTVVVYNRTKERADELAKEFDGTTGKVVSARIEKLCDSCCEIFINTTSLGMHPNVDASAFGERIPKLSPQTLVFDTVYNPMETQLLKQAKAAGAIAVGGVEMFVRQAARQFEVWTNQPAPTDVMRRVIEDRLGNR
ncbi:MAG TPA: shikimate dehydrogenase [Tepidisphaeraceae bacterium]|nr:shikimate dehydrogenase [Tepidisphaeraceae bacterium]